MSCSTNLTYEQIRTAIRNKELFMVPEDNQTREESLKRLELIQGSIIKDYNQEGLYVDPVTKEVILKSTITTEAKKSLKMKFEATKDREILAKLGTAVHSLFERVIPQMLDDKINGRTFSKTLLDLRTDVKVDEVVIDKIIAVAEELVDQAIATQKKINPNENVKVVTEFKLIDPLKSVGGTGDVLFVYSDNTFSYFDFKNQGMRDSKNIKRTPGGFSVFGSTVIKNELDYWENQNSEIQRILIDIVGLKSARHIRNVVSIMDIPADFKAPKGEQLKPHLKQLITGMDSPNLGQLPMSFETTGNKKVDDFLNVQFALLDKLYKNYKNAVTPDKKDRILERIEKVKASILSIQLKGDIQNAIFEATYLLQTAKRRLDIEDINDPLYLSDGEINELLTELEAYEMHFREAGTALLEKNSEKQRTIDIIAAHIQGAIKTVTAKQQDRLLTHLQQQYKIAAPFDKDGKIRNEEFGFIQINFDPTSELANNNFFFKSLARIKDQGIMETKRHYTELHGKLMEKHNALSQYAKENGMSINKVYKLLYNESTGNLHPQLSSEFWDKLKERRKSKDINFMKEHYQLKEDATEKIKIWRERHFEKKKLSLTALVEEGYLLPEQYDSTLNKEMELWDNRNNPLVSDEAWLSDAAVYVLEFKPEVFQKYASEEYKKISSTPALREYYELYREMNSMLRDMLGVNYREVPDNFVANVRSDVVDMIFNQGIMDPKLISQEVLNSLKVREGDYSYNVDVTGKIIREIPKFYINKVEKKSFDLTSNMILFMDMALNYHYMSKQEAHVLALKNVMMQNKATISGKNAGKSKRLAFQSVNLDPANSSNQQAMDALIDYYFYGISIQDAGLSKNAKIVKGLQTLKSTTSLLQLGLKPTVGAAAYIAAKMASIVESSKGQIFSMKSWRQAQKKIWSERHQTEAIVALFDMTSQDKTLRDAKRASASKMSKYLSMDSAMYFLRKADESIDHHVAVAMFLHYGFNADGNLRPLENLPEGTKSLYEMISFDTKTKEVKMDINDNQFVAIKNALRKGQRKIKGSMSTEDIYYGHTTLVLNMFMQFKTWMPGVAKERFHKLTFDETLGVASIGRYTNIFQEFAKETDETWKKFAGVTLPKKLAIFAMEIATFGLHRKLGSNSDVFKINEVRAKRIFNEWKIQNPQSEMTFDDFKKAKQAQIRAMAFELRMIIALWLILTSMGSGDEDDQWYNQHGRETRVLYRILNRTYTELSFFYDFSEGGRLIANTSIPSIAISYRKLSNWVANTWDTGSDLIFGQNSPRDQTPMLYRTSDFIVPMNFIRTFWDDIYEADKEKER